MIKLKIISYIILVMNLACISISERQNDEIASSASVVPYELIIKNESTESCITKSQKEFLEKKIFGLPNIEKFDKIKNLYFAKCK